MLPFGSLEKRTPLAMRGCDKMTARKARQLAGFQAFLGSLKSEQGPGEIVVDHFAPGPLVPGPVLAPPPLIVARLLIRHVLAVQRGDHPRVVAVDIVEGRQRAVV